ncbi:MAG: glycosyltransferase family 39 protein [Myxococcales bacterium]|nr:glycosyltransferase family 39 protein [Myxococcales bacterium]
MLRNHKREVAEWAALFVLVAALLLVGLSSFGIWDPWELQIADAARSRLEGVAPATGDASSLTIWLVALGFRVFGIHEWAGRLPVALMGLVTLVFVALLVRRYEGKRAGLYALVIAATSPLLLLNSRQMLGDAAAFAGQTLLALGLFSAAYPANEGERKRASFLWFALGLLGFAWASWARGVLLGAAPPLLALGLVLAVRGDLFGRERSEAAIRWLVVGSGLAIAAFVARAVMLDRAGYHWLLGGTPRGGNPPAFDESFEAVFHAFAPWSALILPAVARMLWPGAVDDERDAQSPETAESATNARGDGREALRLFAALWVGLGYAAMTLYDSRYGPPTYLALGGLATAIALLLSDVEKSGRSWGVAALIGVLFTGLLIRDYDLYPAGPVGGLPLEAIEVPEVFNPKLWWSAALGFFALTLVVGLGVRPGAATVDLRAPYRFLHGEWKRGPVEKLWLVLAALLALAFVTFSVICYVSPDSLHLNTLAVRIGKKAGLLPFLVPPAVAAGQLCLAATRKLGNYRVLPILLAGGLVGAYTAHGYEPALSAHLSPREVYDTYNALAQPGETLAEYRVGGRAAAYYAHGHIQEVTSEAALVDYLTQPGRHWAVFPGDQLAALDRAYRTRTGQHLYIPDAQSARVLLTASQRVEGHPDHNFLREYVLAEAPTVQHPVGARFQNQIELVGYDLELPHDDYVGAGESFTVVWVWRALARIPGSYKIFLHVDGAGNRLNGDHDPVDGKYPVRLWDEGDVVVDRQPLTVPANYRPGDYNFMIGFFNGNSRLPVVSGPHDDANRVNAGVLRVR